MDKKKLIAIPHFKTFTGKKFKEYLENLEIAQNLISKHIKTLYVPTNQLVLYNKYCFKNEKLTITNSKVKYGNEIFVHKHNCGPYLYLEIA